MNIILDNHLSFEECANQVRTPATYCGRVFSCIDGSRSCLWRGI